MANKKHIQKLITAHTCRLEILEEQKVNGQWSTVGGHFSEQC